MRVIAGKARRLQLKTVEGIDTRPTTDRIKETLFNMINNELYDCRFLDLYSGSGGIGIEALSRGAKVSYFVENARNACECIRENLVNTRLEEYGVVMEMDVISAIKTLDKRNEEPFDFIFMDPPYNEKLEHDILKCLKGTSIIDEYTTIIIEESKDTNVEFIENLGFNINKIKEYKTNKHIFVSVAI